METTLGHLKVLDFSRILAGPWATQTLADMGAEIIKVERPGVGDDTRAWGAAFPKDSEEQEITDSAYFLSANRGKKSITIDLAHSEGQNLIRKLIMHTDVLVENYKVGTLARYGLDYESLKLLNPRLVYCSITGFGQSGPYAELPGYDFVFQGMAGLMSTTGQPDGMPGDGPMKVGLPIGDFLCGLYSATAILAALEYRNISGKGQYIDMSLLDCVISLNSYHAINYFISGEVPSRMGNGHSSMVPYQVFRCKEGDVIVAVGNDSQFRAFCKVIGREDLIFDERYAAPAKRNLYRNQLIPEIEQIMLTRTMAEWVRLLESANVPCGPINNIKQVFEDPQVQHRQMRINLPHSLGVNVPTVASPLRFSDTPVQYGRSAPLLGEHTDFVLTTVLGLSCEKIAALRFSKVI